jgi:hypothetical protein
VPIGGVETLANSGSVSEPPVPVEIDWSPPPVWKRTYGPLPSKFCDSPARPTIAYQNSL